MPTETTLAKPDVGDLSKGVTELERRAAAILVEDDAGVAAAIELLSAITKMEKQAEERRTSLVKPLNDHVKFINGLFRPITEPLERVTKTLKDKILAYRTKQRAKAEEERRRAEEAQRKAAAAKLAAETERAKAEAAAKLAELDAEFAESKEGELLAKSVAVGAQKTAAAAAAKVDQANQVLAASSSAIAAAVPPAKTVVTSSGARSVGRQVWDFEVLDPKLIPREYLAVDLTAIRKAIRAGAREIPGIRIFETEQLAVG